MDHFDLFVEDYLMEKSERLMVIVCASKVDDLLLMILTKRLLPKISGQKDDLLEGAQPLATFSSRIKISYRLGIIDKTLFDLLEQLRAIRNKSAHNVSFNIQKSPFRDHVNNLKKGLNTRKTYALTKERYFQNQFENSSKELQCLLLTLCVILQAIEQKINTLLAIEDTIKISNY